MGGNGWPQEDPAAVRHADTDEIERYQNGERQHAEERRFPAGRIAAGPAHQADGQQAHAGDTTHRDPGAPISVPSSSRTTIGGYTSRITPVTTSPAAAIARIC